MQIFSATIEASKHVRIRQNVANPAKLLNILEKPMNSRTVSQALLVALFTVFMVVSQARTGYVNDTLEITLRTGESTQNSIIRMLSSGEALDVISVNPDTGYAKVTTSSGREGFVLSRFITYEPIARDRLVSANRRLERSAQRIAELESELRDLRGQNTAYSESQSDLEVNNAQLRDELAEIRRTSASALKIAEQNKTLNTQSEQLQARITNLESENQTLAARSRQTWYLAGAGTLTFGILAGLILPRLRFKKRSKWGDL